jgi:hypothetical protein
MAFALGSKVTIWNYVDNTCTGAGYIAVSRS